MLAVHEEIVALLKVLRRVVVVKRLLAVAIRQHEIALQDGHGGRDAGRAVAHFCHVPATKCAFVAGSRSGVGRCGERRTGCATMN